MSAVLELLVQFKWKHNLLVFFSFCIYMYMYISVRYFFCVSFKIIMNYKNVFTKMVEEGTASSASGIYGPCYFEIIIISKKKNPRLSLPMPGARLKTGHNLYHYSWVWLAIYQGLFWPYTIIIKRHLVAFSTFQC